MKVVYDPEVDVLSVLLSDEKIAESDEEKPGLVLDYDLSGNVVAFEILDASNGWRTRCRWSTPSSSRCAVRREPQQARETGD